jgi:hypothetical protein
MYPDRRARSLAVIAALSAAALAACGGSAPARHAAAAARHAAPGFPDPTRVDNPLFPLVPGTQFSYQGSIVEKHEATPHSVVFTVTDLTKMVDGVRTVVAWDRDFLDGRLEEQELAFFAQDSRGNVWNFGEYPEEYDDNGKFTGAPSTWTRGGRGSYGGIHVLARPAPGDQYVEGKVPAIDFYDISSVIGTGRRTCAGSRCYRRVVLVDERSPGESGHQLKYYARGTGLVRVGARGGDSREYLTLDSVRRLSPAALARVRAAVLAMERRAYRISKVYRATRPAACCHR